MSAPLVPMFSEAFSKTNLLTTKYTVGISWDNLTGRPADLDLACLAIDPTGLIMDACFFNNRTALGGAMVHSGDSRDGAASGVDEGIDVSAAALPPYTYALVFVAMCADGGDFGPCETARLHCFAGPTALCPPVALGQAASARSTVVVLGVARRTAAGSGEWAFDATVRGFPAPARTFMDVYADILPMVAIDPVMAQELRTVQPVFQLQKGGSVALPVGLTRVTFGLGWDAGCDVDAGCIGLDVANQLAFKVYFGSKRFGDVVVHSGDNLTGAGDGDDEQIVVDLPRLPEQVTAVFFTVNVYTSGRNFTDVKNEFCRLMDGTGREIVRFNCLDAGAYNGVVLVALYRNLNFPQQWTFNAAGLSAMGNTCHELVDECQDLQRAHFGGGEALPPRYRDLAANPPCNDAPPSQPSQPPPHQSAAGPSNGGADNSDSCCTVQ